MKDKDKTKDQLIWELKKLRQQVSMDNNVKNQEIAQLNRVLETVNSTLDLDLVVEKVMGAMLILFAILMVTGSVNVIANFMIKLFPWFQNIG